MNLTDKNEAFEDKIALENEVMAISNRIIEQKIPSALDVWCQISNRKNDVLQFWFWFKSFNDINEKFEEVVEKVFKENTIAHDNIDTFLNRKNLEDGDLYLDWNLYYSGQTIYWNCMV